MTRLRITMLALLAASTFPAIAQNTWTIDPVHSQANFEVRHLSVTTVRGAITNVTGTVVWDPKDPSKDKVDAVLDATTVNSGNAYRDKDVRGETLFNIEKFPTLTFKSTSASRSGKGVKVTGELTLAGVTKTVVLDVVGPAAPQKGQQGGLVTGLEATTTIKRADFNFGSKYPNAVVSDEVKITLDVEMDQK
ncbi:polyisoprenoid-binding protein [Granulicella sp. WH15]|nr:polyisoprenoid-binding protein [Granulicella sp. WH15]